MEMFELKYYETLIGVLEEGAYKACTPVGIEGLYEMAEEIKEKKAYNQRYAWELLIRCWVLEERLLAEPRNYRLMEDAHITAVLIEILEGLDSWYTRRRRHSIIVEVICWAYFILFAYAAFDKLFQFDKFVVTMGQSGMLTPYAGVLAWAVPIIELVLALMLMVSRFRLVALYGSLSLMTMFTTYIFIVLYVMEKELCGCGAAIEALGWGWHFVLNIFFMTLAVAGIILQYSIGRWNGATLKTRKKE